LPLTTATNDFFNASTVASLFTQHYGAKPGPYIARKIFGHPGKMCLRYFKTIGHRPVTKEEEVRSLPIENLFSPLEKSFGHS